MAQPPFQVVDPRLAAGRGEEFSAGRQRETAESRLPEDAFSLPLNQRIEDSLETDGLQMASVHEAIPESNRGFQMLQRMGWKGSGLGSNEDGIVKPVGGGSEAGVRLGLGKQEEDTFYTASDNIQRKRLEVEIQAEEDEERTARREEQAERTQRIKQDVSDILRTFYCEVCHKQYSSAAEIDVHLSSYDHHHRKRLVEMRAAENERTRKDRGKRERRRQEKEMARLNDQIQKARGGPSSAALPSEAAPPPPPPSGSDDGAPPLPAVEPLMPGEAPPLPPDEPPAFAPAPPEAPPPEALHFNMASSVPNQGAAIGGGSLGVRLGGVQKKKPQRLKTKVAAFAIDSDEES